MSGFTLNQDLPLSVLNALCNPYAPAAVVCSARPSQKQRRLRKLADLRGGSSETPSSSSILSSRKRRRIPKKRKTGNGQANKIKTGIQGQQVSNESLPAGQAGEPKKLQQLQLVSVAVPPKHGSQTQHRIQHQIQTQRPPSLHRRKEKPLQGGWRTFNVSVAVSSFPSFSPSLVSPSPLSHPFPARRRRFHQPGSQVQPQPQSQTASSCFRDSSSSGDDSDSLPDLIPPISTTPFLPPPPPTSTPAAIPLFGFPDPTPDPVDPVDPVPLEMLEMPALEDEHGNSVSEERANAKLKYLKGLMLATDVLLRNMRRRLVN